LIQDENYTVLIKEKSSTIYLGRKKIKKSDHPENELSRIDSIEF